MNNLSKQEKAHYHRHLILGQIGESGQLLLKQAKVLVIGAGGLGNPILLYLTAAGVGEIGIVDDDIVENSNLQRQVLFSIDQVGSLKVDAAIDVLKKKNAFVKFNRHAFRLSKDNALSTIQNYDVVIDGSDNFPTRYLVNDACVLANKVLVFGAIFKFDGQVSVFNYENGPTYRCLFPQPPLPGEVPNCSEVGVLGILPGLVGSYMANEALKIILKIGNPLVGKLLVVDALSLNQSVMHFKKDEKRAEISRLEGNYNFFCGIEETNNQNTITPIEVERLKKDFVFVDVREKAEYDLVHIKNAFLAPLSNLPAYVDHIPKDKPVIVYCHHGMRSLQAINYLKENYGYNNLLNLTGGIDEWSLTIDPSLIRY